ncbi:MAG: hypothetical protein KAI79_07165 [Bacteroidales bacterium]|nr:hypothetical protein [Bacteroidales bacterium]
MSLKEKSINNFTLSQYCASTLKDYNNAIGRLYYSVFNLIQYILNEMELGAGNTKGENSHIVLQGNMQKLFENKAGYSMRDTSKIFRDIQNLKKIRVQADYEDSHKIESDFTDAMIVYNKIQQNLKNAKGYCNV